MKTYAYKLFILLTLTVMTAGCSDSFLDEIAKDETYADNLYTDLNGFRLAKNALLHFPRQERMEPIQSAELGVIWKIGTDVGWANTELSWTRGLNQYTTADLNGMMQFLNGDTEGRPGIFLILYRCISSANLLIARSGDPDVDWQGGNEADNEINKNEMVAHARLIRAWAYRHLVMTFGAVPLNTTEITGENYRDDWQRDPVESIQALIEEDLLFAEQWLPDNSNDVTRLSKAIAQHYLAELYLWQNKPDQAEAKAKAVIDNPNYQLITERYGVRRNEPGCAFMDQFYDGNILPSQGNTEALWVFPNSDVDNILGAYSNTMRRTWVSAYNNRNIAYSPEYGGRGIGRAAITAWVFSLYESSDDRFSEHAIRKSYVDRDGNTVVCQMSASQMTTNNHIWASTRKWDWTYDNPSRYGESYSYADQTYLRLADTYLLLAEALHMQGNNSESNGAAFYINQVRQRAHATPVSAGEVTLDYILDERARELVTEESRRETLMRTGKLIERTRRYNPIASGERNGGAGIQPFHTLLPFPQRIIDANTGHPLKQNPGYN
ncbi:RagB/SusD family nutrient uptake outer membrane protein [Sphingobacterium arenae]|uniref:RagB/SusD family nutrient uptake outer membrane protein n=1 Tax=Sphingobacterium arenae TaxID=1280598 RepID=A0ABR7Y315_9SPHI|nr:RagB/SusD family nutrient uptake outer membrane protein [Sphingobacterium arenae]MBD1425653.1 RagB/SusD family nutrient uptake outer membrane protein [Sphingobacterium arenae]